MAARRLLRVENGIAGGVPPIERGWRQPAERPAANKRRFVSFLQVLGGAIQERR